MTLRSNYEPGTSRWATRRAMWLALGLSDEDMVKPKIAIVNSSSQLAICFSHLDEIARRAKRAIEAAGGIDPIRGVIIEPRHELFGVCFAGKILVFPSAKGSSGWSGFFQTTRLSGTAPVGMVIGRISAKSALGAVVTRVPAVTDLDADPCEVISTGDWVRIDNGTVQVRKK